MSNRAFVDALLVEQYATERGILPAVSPLPAAIAQAKISLNSTGRISPSEERDLTIAVNAAAQVLAPITLEQLRQMMRFTRAKFWLTSAGAYVFNAWGGSPRRLWSFSLASRVSR